MKKRSMLAIASLATGFVVAAITPSHAADEGPLGDLHISDALEHVGHIVGDDSFQTDPDFLGQE
ncbi:hypothetical protein ACGF5O_34515 [Streptomyces sp. NPDC048291]|uniref:hypothetical protein n=1 Tax=Streptomyces sp. NPDC048291 TaxID=3365530 RepID=UPI00372102C1